VLREAGTDRSGVIGGTKVLSDEIVVRVTAEPGHSFLDRMIALVEGANRQKTPNEIALTMLLAAMTLTFLIVVRDAAGDRRLRRREGRSAAADRAAGVPDPDHHRRPAAGHRHRRHEPRAAANVLAKSGKAVEVAGDVDVLLLDKTGTITYGDRQATAFHPLAGIDAGQLRDAALLSSLADPTPEGKSIVRLAREQGAHGRAEPERAHFSSSPRRRACPAWISTAARVHPQGRGDAIARMCALGGSVPAELQARVEQVARKRRHAAGGERRPHVLGVVELSDVVKHGVKERSRAARDGHPHRDDHRRQPADRRRHRAEAGVDDYIAEARRRTSSRASAANRPAAAWWRWSATAPTMRRRWRRPTSAWR
jgi:K+-transporting ATPase ATPase B chain